MPPQPDWGYGVLPWSAIGMLSALACSAGCEREHLGGFPVAALDCDIASSFKPVLTEFEKYLIVHTF